MTHRPKIAIPRRVKLMTLKITLAAVLALALMSCVSYQDEPVEYQRVQAQNAEEIDFAKLTLDKLQARSIQQNREYCGYIGLNTIGRFQASKPRKGRKGSCRPDTPNEDFRILASYHTHAAFSVKYDSELPSTDDLLSDIDEGIDGYVATPGGRVWYTNSLNEKAVLLCSEKCITSDSNYDPQDAPMIEYEYSLETLLALGED